MKELTILKNTYNIGLQKPVKFLHMTDTHITRDSEKENGRAAVFGTTEEQIDSYCFQAIEYAKENNIPIIHTGDLLDYITKENFEFMDKYFSDVDYLFAPGSHEYIHLVPGSKEHMDWRAAGFSENDAFKVEQIKLVAPHFKNNLYFDSKQVGEVNFVVWDVCYSRITEGQFECLKAEVAKGHPIVLGMHIPIHADDINNLEGTSPRERLCSSPELQLAYAKEHNIPNPEEYVRYFDDTTWSAIEYIKNEPLIKLVLCGHQHRNFEGQICEGTLQVMTHATCHGFVREITLI